MTKRVKLVSALNAKKLETDVQRILNQVKGKYEIHFSTAKNQQEMLAYSALIVWEE